ncbi:hypothetical protein [Streptomyces sp. NPDC048191]|uniref:hypothetical protein n=1 Tax=Streptomyces sp. NPDC048191 TaxID=3155484 RepID=UPI0033F1F3AE
MAVTASAAAVVSTASAVTTTAAVATTSAIASAAAVTSAAVASAAVTALVSASAPVLGARRSRDGRRGCGVLRWLSRVLRRSGDVVGRLGGVVEWLGDLVDRRGSRGGFDGRGIGDAGGCKDGHAYSGADHSESTRGHGHFSLSYVRRPGDRPAMNVPIVHITGISGMAKV